MTFLPKFQHFLRHHIQFPQILNPYNIIKMYYPFLQTEFNPMYYYYPTTWNSTMQASKDIKTEPRHEQSSMGSIKIEEKDAEYIQQQFLDNISITVKDLREAGYEKKKQAWTEEEDSKLLTLAKNGIKWSQVAESMEGRSIKMCYSRFKRLQRRGEDRRGYWTVEEDNRLAKLVESYGQNWKELSLYFENRKPKQLRQRYINALTPNISKQPWTLEEDMKLIELYNMFGKRWKSIAEELQRRSENQVKNRFYGRILPLQLKKSKGK